MAKTEKITITLPVELITYADDIAQKLQISRSKAISRCLKEVAEKQMIAEMAEGYTALAKEQREITEAVIDTAREILPVWDNND